MNVLENRNHVTKRIKACGRGCQAEASSLAWQTLRRVRKGQQRGMELKTGKWLKSLCKMHRNPILMEK